MQGNERPDFLGFREPMGLQAAPKLFGAFIHPDREDQRLSAVSEIDAEYLVFSQVCLEDFQLLALVVDGEQVSLLHWLKIQKGAAISLERVTFTNRVPFRYKVALWVSNLVEQLVLFLDELNLLFLVAHHNVDLKVPGPNFPENEKQDEYDQPIDKEVFFE